MLQIRRCLFSSNSSSSRRPGTLLSSVPIRSSRVLLCSYSASVERESSSYIEHGGLRSPMHTIQRRVLLVFEHNFVQLCYGEAWHSNLRNNPSIPSPIRLFLGEVRNSGYGSVKTYTQLLVKEGQQYMNAHVQIYLNTLREYQL